MARDHGGIGSFPVAAEETVDAGGLFLSPAQPATYPTAASIPAHTTGDAGSRPPNRPPLRAIWLTPEEPHPRSRFLSRAGIAPIGRPASQLDEQQCSRRETQDCCSRRRILESSPSGRSSA